MASFNQDPSDRRAAKTRICQDLEYPDLLLHLEDNDIEDSMLATFTKEDYDSLIQSFGKRRKFVDAVLKYLGRTSLPVDSTALDRNPWDPTPPFDVIPLDQTSALDTNSQDPPPEHQESTPPGVVFPCFVCRSSYHEFKSLWTHLGRPHQIGYQSQYFIWKICDARFSSGFSFKRLGTSSRATYMVLANQSLLSYH